MKPKGLLLYMKFRVKCHVVTLKLTNVSPWWWRQYAPLKRRSTSTWLHSATSQKTVNFILATVRTWNLTFITVFTAAHITSYSEVRWMQSISPNTIYFKIHFSITLPLTSRCGWSPPFRLPIQNFVPISYVFPACLYTMLFSSHLSVLHSHTSDSPWSHHSDNKWWKVQTMELLIMQFFTVSHHFICQGPDILLSTLFSNMLNLFFLNIRETTLVI
jgi:hypothetical protein